MACREFLASQRAKGTAVTFKMLAVHLLESRGRNITRSGLMRALHKAGYTWVHITGRAHLKESAKNIARLRHCLEVLKPIYDRRNDANFLIASQDESFCNTKHAAQNSLAAPDERKPGETERSSGRGERLVICGTITNRLGILDIDQLAWPHNVDVAAPMHLFKAKSTGDYHDSMDGDRFFPYLAAQLDRLAAVGTPGKIFLTLDNAPYHKRLAPGQMDPRGKKKAELQAMADELEIEHSKAAPRSGGDTTERRHSCAAMRRSGWRHGSAVRGEPCKRAESAESCRRRRGPRACYRPPAGPCGSPRACGVPSGGCPQRDHDRLKAPARLRAMHMQMRRTPPGEISAPRPAPPSAPAQVGQVTTSGSPRSWAAAMAALSPLRSLRSPLQLKCLRNQLLLRAPGPDVVARHDHHCASDSQAEA